MPSYTWVILDADGTLLDFDHAERLALKTAPASLGIDVPSSFADTYHRINASLWTEFESGHLGPRDVRTLRFQRICQQLELACDSEQLSETFLKHVIEESVFLDGAERLLAAMKDRVGLMLLTNGFADVQRARIAKLGLESCFDHILISEEEGLAKPNPAIFDLAFARMGHPKRKDVLIVGDSLSSDIRGGADYGIATCWFNPTHRTNTSTHVPTYEIAQLDDLLPLIFPMNGGVS